MKKKEEHSVLKTATAQLACKLTDEEQRDRGRQLAAVLGDIQSEESRHDMLKAEMKSAMAALESKRDLLQLQVSRGEETREIKVEDRAFYTEGKVRRVRLDTEETISEREIRPEEQQAKMSLVESDGRST